MTSNTNTHFDSLLFDMDGTLWDAVNSYCAVWNATIDICCPSTPHVEYDALAEMMGKPLEVIYARFIGDAYPVDEFMKVLLEQESILMPRLGGVLYPDVTSTIAKLAENHRLFMVSNCTPEGLPNFLVFTGLTQYFSDHISYGETGCEKDINIATLIKRHNLTAPLYIGDTEGDCNSAHKAGIPFAWASYGFGAAPATRDYTLDTITDLLSICK